MKLVSHAKLAMLGGALAAATLADLTAAAPWAHAASGQPGPTVRRGRGKGWTQGRVVAY